MDLNKVEILPPFKNFFATVGNIPSSYQESMTYYEMLQWFCNYLENTVIPTLNTNGQSVIELQNLFIQLHDYVEKYFNNLDVQQEINNKLDTMASDGTLDQLLLPYFNTYKNEINSIIVNQNSHISQIDNKVNAIADSSPLVASSISNMTDTSKIYVNSSDGHWYWYNGSSWVDGGVYQSSVIADNKVKFNNLDSIIQNYFDMNGDFEFINPEYTTNNCYNNNGNTITYSSNSSVDCTSFDVQAGEIYFISGYSAGQVPVFSVGDSSNKNLIKATSGSNNYSVIIPANGTKLFINWFHVATKPIITKISSLAINPTQLLNIQNNLLNLIKATDCVKIHGLTTTTGTNYVKWLHLNIPNSENLINANDVINFSCDLYCDDISKINGFNIWCKQSGGNTTYAINNYNLLSYNYKNKQCITKINDVIFHIDVQFKYPTYEDTFKEIIISPTTSTSNTDITCKLFNFNIHNNTQNININLFDYLQTSSSIIKEIFNFIGDQISIPSYIPDLGFKKWIAIGDSITEKNYRANFNFLDYCKQDLKYISIVNKGMSGTGYKAYSGHTFVDRIDSINDYDIETDIITVMGSINDIGLVNDYLGQLGDTTTDTLYGSMYSFFSKLFAKFNGVRIGCISPLNWKNSEQSQQLPLYMKALRETCQLFNVPFLDLISDTNLRPNDNTFLNTYYKADGPGNNNEIDTGGVHPNSLGHKILYNRIKEFIKKL